MRKLLYASLFLLILFACHREIEKTYQQLSTPPGYWFSILEGSIEQIEDVRLSYSEPGPWTVQERIADLSLLHGKIFLAVNGRGIAAADISASIPPQFKYYYDPLIFKYRTITTIIPGDKFLLCHIYFNKMLNITSEKNLKIQGISLLKLFPEEEIYQFISLPFQEKNPEWESVGFIPEKSDLFFFEWKFSNEEETRFYHSIFSLDQMTDKAVDENIFRRAYNFREIKNENTPQSLQALFQNAIKRLGSEQFSTAFHFLIRRGEEPIISRYEYYPEDFAKAPSIRLLTLSIFKQNESYFLLTPQGLIIKADEQGRKLKTYTLPLLPGGYIYLDLIITNRRLLVTWEESLFTDVGSAGLFILEDDFFY